MAAKARFTPDLRERWITLIETGRTVEEACADVGISRTTTVKWVSRGRAGDPDAAELARRYDDVMSAGDAAASLTPDDLVRMMERLARKGSFQSIKWLIERAERTGGEDLGDNTAQTDVFTGASEDAVLGELDDLAAVRARRDAG